VNSYVPEDDRSEAVFIVAFPELEGMFSGGPLLMGKLDENGEPIYPPEVVFPPVGGRRLN